jgi:hypothetical protein
MEKDINEEGAASAKDAPSDIEREVAAIVAEQFSHASPGEPNCEEAHVASGLPWKCDHKIARPHETPEECGTWDAESFFRHEEAVSPVPEEPGAAPAPKILWRRDYSNGNTIVRLPTHWHGSGYFHDLIIFFNGSRDESVVTLLLRLWARRLLRTGLLIVDVRPDRVVFGLDMPDPEALAPYQAALDRLAWAFPKRLVAERMGTEEVNLADEVGLGVSHVDDAGKLP